jgi:copper(I)-binding protein
VKLVHLAAKRAVFLVVLSTVGIQAASAQPAPGVYRAGGILVEAPWSREAPGGVRQSVGYMRISNTGSQPTDSWVARRPPPGASRCIGR